MGIGLKEADFVVLKPRNPGLVWAFDSGYCGSAESNAGLGFSFRLGSVLELGFKV